MLPCNNLRLSPLNHTWFIDIDGTILYHNGYLDADGDRILPGVRDFFDSIPPDDIIILVTARKEKYRPDLELFLFENNLRYNHIIYNIPMGERILINDRKPSGLNTAYSINLERDKGIFLKINIDEAL
jgi:hypothetical protein